MRNAFIPYTPLNTPKPVAENIWIVDGPQIDFSTMGVTLPFPTRMTVIRLSDGALFVHSPVAWDPDLAAVIDALGPVAHLIAPNTIHYWWIPDWKARYPNACVHAVPGLETSAKRAFPVNAVLGSAPAPAWAGEIDQLLFTGDAITEAVFIHRPTSTVNLTHLIENFEPSRVRRPWLRWLVKLAHVADPHGSAPYDMRLTFLRHRKALRAGVERMLSWNAQRVILAHGRWYDRDGAAELARAFAWARA
jgi:hypothetical protein